MSIMTRHTFISILKTKIFWVMLLFAILIISLVGYFSVRVAIQESFISDRMHDSSRMDAEEVDMDLELEECGCMRDYSTNLISGMQYFGFMMIAFFSSLASIFLMMGLIPNEVSRRSIFNLIAKPLSRTDIFLGKLFGGWAAVFMFNFVLGMMFTIFVFLAGAPFMWKFLIISLIAGLVPILYGSIAFVLGTLFRSTAVGFFSIVTLFMSSDLGNIIIYGVLTQWLKWENLADFILAYLPPLPKIEVLVYSFIDYSLFEYFYDVFEEMGSIKVYGEWWQNALFVGAYLAAIILIGLGIFRRKEFN